MPQRKSNSRNFPNIRRKMEKRSAAAENDAKFDLFFGPHIRRKRDKRNISKRASRPLKQKGEEERRGNIHFIFPPLRRKPRKPLLTLIQ